jgi:hypothetical protein
MPYFMFNHDPRFVLVIVLLVIWTLIWKGLALWKSARRDETVWFVVFLIVNTLGILEILYLYFFSNDKIGSDSITENK